MSELNFYEDAKKVYTLSSDDLLENLAKSIGGSSLIGKSREQLIQRAKKWINDKIPEIQQAICYDDNLKKSVLGEEIMFIALLADVIYAKLGVNSPATIAALLVRIGFIKICKNC